MTGTNTSARQDRLKAALRDNLRRRKVQTRGRAEAAETDGDRAEDGEVHDRRRRPDRST